MQIPLYHLAKHRGGRLQNVATFSSACTSKRPKDASWDVLRTIQAANDAADAFAHVGIAKLLEQDVVVKIMLYGRMSAQEQKVAQLFRERPHRNIVQTICTLKCEDNPVRWLRRVEAPQPMCVGKGNTFVMVVQEYIPNGDLHIMKTKWTMEFWSSMVQQLTYACLEWFESYGFLHGDWHFGNVLMDPDENIYATYAAFGKRWRVQTHGIAPVLTDFSRSVIVPPKSRQLWQLTDQIGILWDMFQHKCPEKEMQRKLQTASIQVGSCEKINDLLAMTSDLF